MPARRLTIVVRPLVDLILWLFSDLAAGVDLFLGLLAAWWLYMMVARSEIFDRGNYVGMDWLPDGAWISFVCILTVLHGAGLVRLTCINLRVTASMLSAWYWILIAISLSRLGLTTGTGTYALIGLAALAAAIYVSGRKPLGR